MVENLPYKAEVSAVNHPSLINQFYDMLNDVNFTDPPIIAIIAFLTIWIFILFYNRQNTIASLILFGLTTLFIGITQFLDGVVRRNWSSLYFTSSYFSSPTNVFGFFFWALPLIIASVLFLLLLSIDVIKLYLNESFKTKIRNAFKK